MTAFYGQAPQGQVDFPYQVNSWADYQSQFGGLDSAYLLSYAVYLFFLNGGSTALVVRYNDPTVQTAAAKLSDDTTLVASSPGAWAEALTVTVDTGNLVDPNVNQFNLTIADTNGSSESYPGVNLRKGTPQYLGTRLVASQFVNAGASTIGTTLPTVGQDKTLTVKFAFPQAAPPAGAQPAAAPADTSAPIPLGDPNLKTGIYALLKADIFNILCLPADPANTYLTAALEEAAAFCTQQRAMLIVDTPSTWSAIPLTFSTITTQPQDRFLSPSPNAAVYYPNLVITDAAGATFQAGSCGAVAGVWAATDSNRGVWKAPAGTAATITGITGFTAQVDDKESGIINPVAVNALRTMPAVGPVVWGARTTVGSDQAQNQWKYLPIRRLALYIEESLRRGTQWAVFEPNDEPLWSSLRLNVTTFMQGLFTQGAFQGSTPAQAYVVMCDATNNPQSSIDLGIVNILVGFAPLYPAEFVIISIQQQAGQA
jgi:phage tail sheath protein FI